MEFRKINPPKGETADTRLRELLKSKGAVEPPAGMHGRPEAVPRHLMDELPELARKMRAPEKELRVVIVDDSPQDVKGMEFLLGIWPRIRLEIIEQERGKEIEIPENTDILLLDETMQGITGTEIAERLIANGFRGLLASTSAAGKGPDFTEMHYEFKRSLSEYGLYAEEFVEFFNRLIESGMASANR